jgi:hypothetical protein
VLADALQICHPHAAGIDIGEAEPWVAVPPGGAPQPVRRCGTFTVALDALADWLIDWGVTPGALASTGGYWLPLCELLEARGVPVLLIEPRHAKRAPGRPTTARLDCTGRPRLHAYGLRAGAFRPAAQGGVRRSSLRHRQRLLTSAAQPMQHRQKALQPMPRKLTQGVSESTGVTGMAILKARLAGERDPVSLAPLRHPHCQPREDESAKALQGPWRAAHLLAWQQAVALSDFSHQPLALCDRQINAHLATCADHRAGQPLPPQARRHQHTNAPRFDARPPL